jgi:hypothetical protein
VRDEPPEPVLRVLPMRAHMMRLACMTWSMGLALIKRCTRSDAVEGVCKHSWETRRLWCVEALCSCMASASDQIALVPTAAAPTLVCDTRRPGKLQRVWDHRFISPTAALLHRTIGADS